VIKFEYFNLISLIDSFHSNTDGGAKFYRHRLVASLILGILFYTSVIVFVASYFLPLGSRDLYIVQALFAFVGIGVLLSIYILRGLRRHVLAVNTLMAFLCLALLYLAVITGGIVSPVAICLMIFPVVAAISIDSKAGVIWGGLALASWSLLFAGQNIGLPIQNAMRYVDDDIAFYISILTTYSFIAFVALYYSEMSKTLRTKLLDERSEYYYLANHDTQTGAINRHYFLELLKLEIVNCERSGGSFCLFFIDLTDFKKANDDYGHHFGDEILETFTRRLRHRVRSTDTVARVGGDEFCIISRDMKDHGDAKRGEQRIKMILQEPLALKKGTYTLNASIGWAIYPIHAKDYETLLKCADQRMYEAKRLEKASRT
jgi:diguanylate cyclase (GGDEF)-like protein